MYEAPKARLDQGVERIIVMYRLDASDDHFLPRLEGASTIAIRAGAVEFFSKNCSTLDFIPIPKNSSITTNVSIFPNY